MRLTINFHAEDLKEANKNNQKIFLTKQYGQYGRSLIWGAFQPWQRNIIEWDNDCSIYASNYIEEGIIYKLAEKKALPGVGYSLACGYFEESEDQDREEYCGSSYFIENMMNGYNKVIVGLAQNIYINGQLFENNPINKYDLFYGCKVAMSYPNTVEVGLASGITNSMICSASLKVTCSLKYDIDKTDYTITYDGKTGTFI